MSAQVERSTSSESSSEPGSFLETLSAMLTSTFNQTATSQLTFAVPPPRPSSNIASQPLDALGLDTGIKLLHDHINYVYLNPIVTDCHAVTADSDEGRKLNVPKLLAEFADQANGGGGGGGGGVPLPAIIPASPTDTESYGANVSGWKHYSVTDNLPNPFGLPGKTMLKYTIALRNVADGFESLVAAAGGVTIYGSIRVIRASEGLDGENGFRDRGAEKKLWLQERAEVRCWVGTAWYVGKTLRESHESAHERFRGWWEREVRKRLSRMGGGGAGMAPVGSALGQ